MRVHSGAHLRGTGHAPSRVGTAILGFLTLVAIAGCRTTPSVGAPSHATLARDGPPPSVYVADTFTKVHRHGWGRANVGGRWALRKGSTRSFSVAHGEGLVAIHAADFRTAEQIIVLPNDHPLTFTGSFDVTFDENINTLGAQHGGVVAYLVARFQNTSANGYYRLGVVWDAKTGHLWLRNQNAAGKGFPGDFTIEKDTGVNPSAGTPARPPFGPYRVKVQLSGTRPTNFASKLWKVGTPEPVGWALTGTDRANLGPQVAGPVGFRASNDLYTGTSSYLDFTSHIGIANVVVTP